MQSETYFYIKQKADLSPHLRLTNLIGVSCLQTLPKIAFSSKSLLRPFPIITSKDPDDPAVKSLQSYGITI